jgi:ABC-2 type transport system permease protein
MLIGQFSLQSKGARIGKLLSIIVITLLGIGATFFFYMVFEKLLELEGIGEPLMQRVLGITIITVFWLLVISNLITGIATIFRSPEITFLVSHPVSSGRIFLSRFADNLVYSSWSLAILGIPIIVAWGLIYSMPIWLIICIILFGIIPLVVIAAEIGSLALGALIHFARVTSARAAVILVTVLTLVIMGFWIHSQRFQGFVVGGVARYSNVDRYLAQLNQQGNEFLSPAHWLINGLHSLQAGNNGKALFLGILLTLTMFVWLRWITVIADRLYYSAWTAFSELSGSILRSKTGSLAKRFTKGWLPNPLNAMLLKDLIQFTRNPNQWAQFLILFAFMVIYLLNLIYISSRFDFDNPYWKTIVLFLNFAFTGFILATLSVRFVFPLISLEGRGFWVVRSSPVSTNGLFREKFLLAFVVFLGLCELMVFFSNRALHLDGAMITLTTTGTFLMGASLCSLATGMGALLPDFSVESPMRIASTYGGVLTVVFSLVYVTLMVAIIAWPVYGYFIYLVGHEAFPMTKTIQALVLVFCLNVIVIYVPLRMGRLAIQSRDI